MLSHFTRDVPFQTIQLFWYPHLAKPPNVQGYDFLTLDHLDFTWQISVNGVIVETGKLEGQRARGGHTLERWNCRHRSLQISSNHIRAWPLLTTVVFMFMQQYFCEFFRTCLQQSSWSTGINVQAHCAQTVQVPTKPSSSLQAFWQHDSFSPMTHDSYQTSDDSPHLYSHSSPRCQRVNATCSFPLVCASCSQRDRQEMNHVKEAMLTSSDCPSAPICWLHFHSPIYTADKYKCMSVTVILHFSDAFLYYIDDIACYPKKITPKP